MNHQFSIVHDCLGNFKSCGIRLSNETRVFGTLHGARHSHSPGISACHHLRSSPLNVTITQFLPGSRQNVAVDDVFKSLPVATEMETSGMMAPWRVPINSPLLRAAKRARLEFGLALGMPASLSIIIYAEAPTGVGMASRVRTF